jgi:transposase
LPAHQLRALEWLIGGSSVKEAARAAGVTRQTISRWLRCDPDFRAMYDGWRQEAADIVQSRMVAASEYAMDNLLHAIRDKYNLKASEFVLRTLATSAARRVPASDRPKKQT